MSKTTQYALAQAKEQFDPFGFHLHNDVQQDDSYLVPGPTTCGCCGAVYGTSAWWNGCPMRSAKSTANRD